ncbi:hypothetical protein [Ensifer sp. LCM 4579]|uniref:hypothetical protein n=1 Tax=Ensifer sp. LCM 4579 TaxID=1848292 RepID=UPI0008D95903|nr:hypothetical protein [Ensifer sp. LCM 4579]OHV81326.1 hypothetical protein LCM4579_20030 [Ensifer sp. LCM 4579]
MGTLGAVLSALLAADLSATAARYRRNAILWAIIAVLLGSTYVFVLVAIALALAQHYSPVIAAAMVAAVLFATALILILVLVVLHARDRRLAEERRRRALLQANLGLIAVTGVVRSQPLLALAAAIAVGTLLGLRTGRRRGEPER